MSKTRQYVCANKNCAKAFIAKIADRRRGWAKCCSKSCAATVSNRKTGKFLNHIRGYSERYADDTPTFSDAHLFSNEEHDCNKGA